MGLELDSSGGHFFFFCPPPHFVILEPKLDNKEWSMFIDESYENV
jgi:hypothetical protein